MTAGLQLDASQAGPLPATPPAPLTSDQLQGVVTVALAVWESAGVDAATIARLSQLDFQISPPGGKELGLASAGFIEFDPTAQGYGWYVDATASSAGAFRMNAGGNVFDAVPGSPAWNKVDLLTVVLHELGHEMGLGDSDDPLSVMDDQLAPGVRRLPVPLSSVDPAPAYSAATIAAPVLPASESNGGAVATSPGADSARGPTVAAVDQVLENAGLEDFLRETARLGRRRHAAPRRAGHELSGRLRE